MPTVAERPDPKVVSHSRRIHPGQPSETVFQGAEGRALADLLGKVRQQLAESATARLEEEEAIDEVDYQPVLPDRAFQMDVYVRMVGRGEPMPYPLDDDQE